MGKNDKDVNVDNIEREILKNLGRQVGEMESGNVADYDPDHTKQNVSYDEAAYEGSYEGKESRRKDSRKDGGSGENRRKNSKKDTGSGDSRKKENRKDAGSGDDHKKDAQKKNTRKDGMSRNREIVIISYISIALFVGMIIYLVNFLASDNTDMLSNPYNKLQSLLEEYTIRGNILSSDGQVLATTEVNSKGKEVRKYPYGRMFAHAVGYSGNGKTGIESQYNIYLLKSGINPIDKAVKELRGEKCTGDSVVTTLDSGIQKIAYDALGSHRGAVLVMDPDDGSVIAMVSKPDFEPGKIASDWKNLVKLGGDSVLLNRATQGLYPPGSTFKLITMIEYMREHPDYASFEYNCKGTTEIDKVTVNCHNKKSHGKLNIYTALAQSCNGAFATMGMKLDIGSFNKTCKSLLFNKKLPYEGVYNQSVFNLPEGSNAGLVTQTSFGQGKTMITPLHNGLIACMVANGGCLVTPHLAASVQSAGGTTLKEFSYSKGKRLLSKKEVSELRKAMKEVISSGTAGSLAGRPYKVYGKTGSAEYDSSGESHAWFIGYAKKGDKKVAVSIVVEGAGTGSEYAVPIARKIFDAYY